MNTTEIRELNVAELDLVSGGAHIEAPIGGQVKVQLNTETGGWAVWLGGKLYASGPQ